MFFFLHQKELAGDKKEGGEEEGGAPAAEDPEVLEARREEEERRRQKYAKMENEREKVRQNIRDKYNIKKPEENLPPLPDLDGSLNAKKKTPAQLRISTEDDEFNPLKMATGLFESVKSQVSSLNISFPWSSASATPAAPPTTTMPSSRP